MSPLYSLLLEFGLCHRDGSLDRGRAGTWLAYPDSLHKNSGNNNLEAGAPMRPQKGGLSASLPSHFLPTLSSSTGNHKSGFQSPKASHESQDYSTREQAGNLGVLSLAHKVPLPGPSHGRKQGKIASLQSQEESGKTGLVSFSLEPIPGKREPGSFGFRHVLPTGPLSRGRKRSRRNRQFSLSCHL